MCFLSQASALVTSPGSTVWNCPTAIVGLGRVVRTLRAQSVTNEFASLLLLQRLERSLELCNCAVRRSAYQTLNSAVFSLNYEFATLRFNDFNPDGILRIDNPWRDRSVSVQETIEQNRRVVFFRCHVV